MFRTATKKSGDVTRVVLNIVEVLICILAEQQEDSGSLEQLLTVFQICVDQTSRSHNMEEFFLTVEESKTSKKSKKL